MSALPPCPKCASTFTYDDGTLVVIEGIRSMGLKSEFVKKA